MHSPDVFTSRPSRHARVWLDPLTWRAHVRSSLDPRALDVLDDWIAKGRPAVARRREEGPEDDCYLGVALSPALGKARIPFVVGSRAVTQIAAPLSLDQVIDSAPAEWQEALRDLVVQAQRVATSFHVYGSLAWQHIARETYVTPNSDVDLLWTARDVPHITRVLELLTGWERDSGIRADGELLLSDGSAVAWRELLTGHDRVLVKTDEGVTMRPSPLRAASIAMRSKAA